MAADKLSIISDCLLLKGQSIPTTEDDGSKEWNVCSAAYEQAVGHLVQEHNWGFATETDVVARVGDSADENYNDEYALPGDMLHLVWVRQGGLPLDWRMVRNKIQVSADTESDLVVKYVARPEPDAWPPMFASALKEHIFAAIEMGLKHDTKMAMAHREAADEMIGRARSRTDQQEPKRSVFVSSYRTARGSRRG